MHSIVIPDDLKAEVLLNYIPKEQRSFRFNGSHLRNAYMDIREIKSTDEGAYEISLCRNSLYDILPEGLFHTLDRFDRIPANEYKERFAEECEKQEREEADARNFFLPFDTFLMELQCVVSGIKQHYSDNSILADILCGPVADEDKDNRFIQKAMCFVPMCSKIRGDKTLLSLMLRKIFNEEGLEIQKETSAELFTDTMPRYGTSLDTQDNGTGIYLGNEFYEDTEKFVIRYWNDSTYNTDFESFLSEIRRFEKFLNDWFVSIESVIEFRIITDGSQAMLSDESYSCYLNHNANI